MISLYTKGTVICKLKNEFLKIFSHESKPTSEHLFELALSIIRLNGFQSVQSNHSHFIEMISDHKLKSFYYTLNESTSDIDEWMKAIICLAIDMIPEKLIRQPFILSIDDTMIEKSGKKFDNASRLFDYASHNGSNYLDGHCFVSLLMSIPYEDENGKRYISLKHVGFVQSMNSAGGR